MAQRQPSDELTVERRMEVYQALADDQDLHEFTREQALRHVAVRFGLSEAALLDIESEGREKLWPPF